MKILFATLLLLNIGWGLHAYSDYSTKRKIRFQSLAVLQDQSIKRYYSRDYISRKISQVRECESLSEAINLYREIVLKKNDAKRTLLFRKGKGKQRKKYFIEWDFE